MLDWSRARCLLHDPSSCGRPGAPEAHTVSGTPPPGIMADPAPDPLPPLPAAGEDLYVIHYSSALPETCPDRITPVSAVVVQHHLTGCQVTFAAFTAAECAGVPPAEFLARFPELERGMLRDFADYAAGRRSAVWVHWRMRDIRFGFDVLAHRARVHRLRPPDIPPERRFDLSNYLRRRYGDDFAPHPRLWNAVLRNLGDVPGLRDERATAAAWQRGDYAAVLWSLAAKVGAIARLFDRARAGTFLTGAGGGPTEPDARLAVFGGHRRADSRAALFRLAGAEPPAAEVVGPDLLVDPPGAADPGRLTARQWAMLEELLRSRAFDRGACVTTADLARAVDGPGANPNSFKRPVGRLCSLGLVDTTRGRDGGVWLTPAGRALAEQRRRTA